MKQQQSQQKQPENRPLRKVKGSLPYLDFKEDSEGHRSQFSLNMLGIQDVVSLDLALDTLLESKYHILGDNLKTSLTRLSKIIKQYEN